MPGPQQKCGSPFTGSTALLWRLRSGNGSMPRLESDSELIMTHTTVARICATWFEIEPISNHLHSYMPRTHTQCAQRLWQTTSTLESLLISAHLPDSTAYGPKFSWQKYPCPQKKQGNSRKISASASLAMLKPLTVWITINRGKFLKEIGIPDHPTWLLRHRYAGQ